MRTYIKKLQSKSIDSRKQILVGSLIVCMSFVALVWVNSLGYKFNKEKTAKVEEGVKPFALFGQSISNTYKDITASVGNVKTLKEGKSKEAEEQKQIDLILVENQ